MVRRAFTLALFSAVAPMGTVKWKPGVKDPIDASDSCMQIIGPGEPLKAQSMGRGGGRNVGGASVGQMVDT